MFWLTRKEKIVVSVLTVIALALYVYIFYTERCY